MSERIDDVTKPVRGATQRPTPRWVGWFLIVTPSLAAAGPLWGAGPWTSFRVAAAVLFLTAAWDWWRFQDRSRTFFTALGLGLAFQVSGLVALAWSKPPAGSAWNELLAVGLMFALAAALVQLYRTAETVLTIARGWLYMAVLVEAVGLWELVTGRHLSNYHLAADRQGTPGWTDIAGLFGTPSRLAGVLVATALVMAVGWSLEHDRRLRWAYLAVCVPMPYLLWRTGSTLGLLLFLVVCVCWLAVYSWGRRVGIAALAVVVVALAPGRAFLVAVAEQVGSLFGGTTSASFTGGDAFNLLRDGAVLLVRSTWLGVGPAGFSHAMTTRSTPYFTHGVVTPHSAVVEVASQYGISMFVLVTLAGIGLAKWAVDRLRRTARQPLRGAPRIVAMWTLVATLMWPWLGMLGPTYLDQSVAALFVATIAMWARHIERPLGRRVRPSEAELRNLATAPPTPPDKER
ncbi:MAG: O-antigen ligase family protein [Propionibacteriaceae bacterium]